MPAREFKNSSVLFLLLAFSKSLYIGINAWLKAPSAKNLLNKFGIFKQITKISWKIDAPRRFVVDISLIKPKILDSPVPDITFLRLENNPSKLPSLGLLFLFKI